MRLLTLFFVIAFFQGCEDPESPLAKKTVNAQLVNNLAVDGCSWHFTVDAADGQQRFAASNDSQTQLDAIIESALPDHGLYTIPVRVEFELTGKKQDVACGWGNTVKMDEIKVYSLNINQN